MNRHAHEWNGDRELGEKFDHLIRLLEQPNHLKGMIMALQADVQHLVDQVAANTSAVAAAASALEVEAKQIADLQAQLAAIIPGDPIDAEDLAAIKTAADQLQQTNIQLQAAVPANATPAVTTP